eukprot:GHVL01023447.1.p2 GENE.GHVL01023447.1~~GHVL01023447.1.p2  ORF type:complete len:104 (+),score=22.84 GHVL01023447.1:139-450(+)
MTIIVIEAEIAIVTIVGIDEGHVDMAPRKDIIGAETSVHEVMKEEAVDESLGGKNMTNAADEMMIDAEVEVLLLEMYLETGGEAVEEETRVVPVAAVYATNGV